VPLAQTSDASDPNVVRDRAPLVHTAAGIVDASEVDAVSTVALVFELMVVIAFEIEVASDDEAERTLAFVVAIEAASDVEAFNTVAFVFALTEAVPAEMFAAIEDDAASTVALVLAFTAVIIEDDADVTSDLSANDPDVSVASVRFRVPYVQTSDAVIPDALVSVRVLFSQTSAARVPNVVRDRAPEAQTAVGMVEASEVDAFRTVAFVLVLIVVTAFEIEVLTATIDAPSDDEAESMFAFVVTIEAASDVDAARTVAFVFAFTEAVPAVMFAARLVEADVTSD
jgi:hypothetical protein